jgi:hypothetical protein
MSGILWVKSRAACSPRMLRPDQVACGNQKIESVTDVDKDNESFNFHLQTLRWKT